ncbi:MAG TPA: hypothetical protein VJC09_00640 [Candidatus Saccharimonadales bacterium]|nr:hypothetical protein [Candidatus Saccharimonadales bacterium]
MFGNNAQDQPAPADNQQVAADNIVHPQPSMAQPYELVSSAPDPAAAAPPPEPTSAPVTDDDAAAISEEPTAPAEAPPAAEAVEAQPATDATLPPPVAEPEPAAEPAEADGTDDLTSIKQEALQQLSPLVGHLDQTPEEKFRTTMMMIQAADNQSLIKTAYDAAQQITDEKEKAQALLDVINEINYFTQQKKDAKS